MPGLSPQLTAHNSLRHPTPLSPTARHSALPYPTRTGPQISVQTLSWVQAAGGDGHIALCWPKGCPAAAALPSLHRLAIGGLFPGIPSPRPGARGGELPVILFCRYCPLKTTPRRSFRCPHSEATWACLPEFSVFKSVFKWGLHLAWNIQKGHPNSFYHGGPPCSPPGGLVPGACVCGVQTMCSGTLPPRAPLRPALGGEGLPPPLPAPVPATPDPYILT